MAGSAQQFLRHMDTGACRRGCQGRQVRAGVDRQGGKSDECHGRLQTARRNGVPDAAERHYAIRYRPFRQRVRKRRAVSFRAFANKSAAAAP